MTLSSTVVVFIKYTCGPADAYPLSRMTLGWLPFDGVKAIFVSDDLQLENFNLKVVKTNVSSAPYIAGKKNNVFLSNYECTNIVI